MNNSFNMVRHYCPRDYCLRVRHTGGVRRRLGVGIENTPQKDSGARRDRLRLPPLAGYALRTATSQSYGRDLSLTRKPFSSVCHSYSTRNSCSTLPTPSNIRCTIAAV